MAPLIMCLGLSHHSAPIVLRERFTFSHESMAALAETAGREITLLVTCNRIELYAALETPPIRPKEYMVQLLSKLSGLNPELFVGSTYLLTGAKAMNHLLRVAAGLDSLVLGESQILGQVAEAYQLAADLDTTGPILTTLFQSAVRTGKRARTETAIGQNPTSLSSIAINLAQQVLGDLSERQILIVGTGEMGQLAVKTVRHRGLAHIAVANRTLAKAEELVAGSNGRSYGLEQLPEAIAAADVVITTARTTEAFIDESAISIRERPLVIVDIALPRNVAASVADMPNVQLFDLEDLETIIDESLTARQVEIPAVEAIIAEEYERFLKVLRYLTVKPLIVDMRRKAEQIRQTELERSLRYLGDLEPETLAHIQHFSRSLVNKLLHEPTIRLREVAGKKSTARYEAALRTLFGLTNL